jgi:hypothetical protein
VPNVGDYNQGVTIGSVTIPFGLSTPIDPAPLDAVLHPIDTQPMVQLTPIGEDANLYAFTANVAVSNGIWYVYIQSSQTAEAPLTINYMILSRIEPKHIQDHTKP